MICPPSSPSSSVSTERTEQDLTQPLTEQVKAAFEKRRPLVIQGSGSKHFLHYPLQGEALNLSPHQGVTSYQPSELTITVRSGTPLQQVKTVLAEKNQMLAFEPPDYSAQATLGGTIACGLSGPSRPFYGATRDFVLGCRIINGRGETLKFGGEVMKNVAGYDLSRLMTGAHGTLGVLLDVSLKVLPLPTAELSLKLPMDTKTMLKTVRDWTFSGHPLSAACHYNDNIYIRLSGSCGSVRDARQQIGGEEVDNQFWSQLNQQTLPFFTTDRPVWRLSIPIASDDFEQCCPVAQNAPQIIDWGGAQRWLITAEPAAEIFEQLRKYGGHAQKFNHGKNQTSAADPASDLYQPLEIGIYKLHQRIKEALDPQHILNPGRIYPEL